PYLPRAVDLRRRSLKEHFLGTFRCQTYWLLATRGAWRVLWSLARRGRYVAAKTDRVQQGVARHRVASTRRGSSDGSGRAPAGIDSPGRLGEIRVRHRGGGPPGRPVGS